MVSVKTDLTGQRFGKLIVIKQIDDYITPSGEHRARWLCKCDCGNYTASQGTALRAGLKRSCGCLRNNSTTRRRAHKTANNRVTYYTPDDVYVARINTKTIKDKKTFMTFEEALEQCKRWDEILHPTKRPIRICTDNCKSCKYMKWLDHYCRIPYCDYFCMEDKRRPCHAGDGCTVKQPRPDDHEERMKKHYSDSFVHSMSWAKAKIERVNKNLEYTSHNF